MQREDHKNARIIKFLNESGYKSIKNLLVEWNLESNLEIPQLFLKVNTFKYVKYNINPTVEQLDYIVKRIKNNLKIKQKNRLVGFKDNKKKNRQTKDCPLDLLCHRFDFINLIHILGEGMFVKLFDTSFIILFEKGKFIYLNYNFDDSLEAEFQETETLTLTLKYLSLGKFLDLMKSIKFIKEVDKQKTKYIRSDSINVKLQNLKTNSNSGAQKADIVYCIGQINNKLINSDTTSNTIEISAKNKVFVDFKSLEDAKVHQMEKKFENTGINLEDEQFFGNKLPFHTNTNNISFEISKMYSQNNAIFKNKGIFDETSTETNKNNSKIDGNHELSGKFFASNKRNVHIIENNLPYLNDEMVYLDIKKNNQKKIQGIESKNQELLNEKLLNSIQNFCYRGLYNKIFKKEILEFKTHQKENRTEFNLKEINKKDIHKYVCIISEKILKDFLKGMGLRILKRKIFLFLSLMKNEKLTINQITRYFKINHFKFLGGNNNKAKRGKLNHFVFFWLKHFTTNLLNVFFYITETDKSKNTLSFYLIEEYNYYKNKSMVNYLENFEMLKENPNAINRGKISNMTQNPTFVRFIPKKSKLRPILNHSKKTSNKLSLNESRRSTQRILKEICSTQIGNSYFNRYKFISDIHKFIKKVKENNKVYILKLDLLGCFDNIPHKKFLENLENLFSKNIYYLRTYWGYTYTNKALKGQYNHSLDNGKLPFNEFLHQNIREDNCFLYKDGYYITRTKEMLIQNIKCLIKENYIQNNKKIYRQKIGIPQGSVLSTYISAYYFSVLDDMFFNKIMKNGKVFRYVDDFILISSESDEILSFISKCENLKDFGIIINYEKLAANFDISNCMKKSKLKINDTDYDPTYPNPNLFVDKYLSNESRNLDSVSEKDTINSSIYKKNIADKFFDSDLEVVKENLKPFDNKVSFINKNYDSLTIYKQDKTKPVILKGEQSQKNNVLDAILPGVYTHQLANEESLSIKDIHRLKNVPMNKNFNTSDLKNIYHQTGINSYLPHKKENIQSSKHKKTLTKKNYDREHKVFTKTIYGDMVVPNKIAKNNTISSESLKKYTKDLNYIETCGWKIFNDTFVIKQLHNKASFIPFKLNGINPGKNLILVCEIYFKARLDSILLSKENPKSQQNLYESFFFYFVKVKFTLQKLEHLKNNNFIDKILKLPLIILNSDGFKKYNIIENIHTIYNEALKKSNIMAHLNVLKNTVAYQTKSIYHKEKKYSPKKVLKFLDKIRKK